ncbi:hypothetical protein [Blastopirellula marina]|uniref:Uncharacterized protein n=1 Tax=Blastopirellula marina TaxID=124 RepID=A0A2S8GSH5_9BACT|nr:hypothetical protein [Blastopirellula marina]PQO47379.1 hypothetical protein C5Y93_04875 [Blastopirellula marina]
MLKNAFKPNTESRARVLLKRGEIVEVDERAGKVLIDKGYAAKFEAPKEDAPNDKWTVAALTKYAEDNGIDLGEAKTKAEILAKFEAPKEDQ